jgi:hypothetical protein
VDTVTAAQLAGVLSRLADGALGEAGKQIWDGLARLLGRVKKPETQRAEILPAEALDDLAAHPGDGGRAVAMGEALLRVASSDPEFAALLRAWWADAERLAGGEGQNTNIISGNVSGPVVQARDIHGPVSFGEHQPTS